MQVILNTTFLARDVLVDAYSGSISAIRLLEAITVSHFPIDIGSVDLVILWEVVGKEGEEAQARLNLISPSGKIVEQMNRPERKLIPSKANLRWVTTINSTMVDEPGRWRIGIEYQKDNEWSQLSGPSFLVELNESLGLPLVAQEAPSDAEPKSLSSGDTKQETIEKEAPPKEVKP